MTEKTHCKSMFLQIDKYTKHKHFMNATVNAQHIFKYDLQRNTKHYTQSNDPYSWTAAAESRDVHMYESHMLYSLRCHCSINFNPRLKGQCH